MTRWEQQSSGRISGAAPTPHAPPSASANGAIPWEAIYEAAPPAVRQELLALAGRQGVIYSHQLPAITANGRPAEPCWQLLTSIFNGQLEELTPVALVAVEFFDTALDATQREAVAKVLSTPDLCLIQGWPGTGKSRVIAEIVTQAATRGLRVLLLAPSTAAIDRVLEQVGGRDAVCAVRCLGREEKPAELPQDILALTFAARLRSLQETATQAARREVEQSHRRYERRRGDEASYPRLQELAAHRRRLQDAATTLDDCRAQLLEDVEQAAARQEIAATPSDGKAFSGALADCLNERQTAFERMDAALAKLCDQVDDCRRTLEDLKRQIGAIRPLADAKENGRWWTVSWWKAVFRGEVVKQANDLDQRRQTLQAEMQSLGEDRDRLRGERQQAEAVYQSQRGGLITAECDRCRADLDARGASLKQEEAQLAAEWQRLLDSLDDESPRPASATPEDARRGAEDFGQQLQRDAAAFEFARQWVTCLEQSAGTWLDRLLGCVNLVAATTAEIAGDEQFGDSLPHGQDFDLLVIDEAHLLTESELVSLARRARRWTLVGEPSGEAPRVSASPHSRASPVRPVFFQRLWQHVHSDLWVYENGQLCCRLRPVPPEQRSCLECERVADFPEIELRILAVPHARPVLAEVVFPADMSIVQAKQFIFRELEELPVRALPASLSWSEDRGRLLLQLTQMPCANLTLVDLEPGVREMADLAGSENNRSAFLPLSASTCCLEFDPSAGWGRPRADEWARRRLCVHDCGRTTRLGVVHRMHSELAAFLLGFHSVPLAPQRRGAVSDNGRPSVVEFIRIPLHAPDHDTRKRNGRGAPGSANHRTAKGGAGLELDLADFRHRDRLPSELRAGLPAHGIVNYYEAQAVVRWLEQLAQDPGTPGEVGAVHNGQPVIGVLALYPAQAELIRRMIAQSPMLAALKAAVHVDVPEAFRQRECPIVLLSLTRSHPHRAVSFGDGPDALLLALTRARQRLIVFGDPGTLARRCQWEGPVDHLPEQSAHRERELVAHLLAQLHSEEPQPCLEPVLEGSHA